jgi:hypothetical protein
MNARRPEEHHRVLDLLALEAAKRLGIFGQDANRTRFFAFEERPVEIRERLRFHPSILL